MKIVKGKQRSPLSVLVYGPEGIGKSSFAAGAPSPLFLDAEGGTHHLNVDRVHVSNWSEVREAIQSLIKSPGEYKTLVVDTIDWVEKLIWDHICARDKKADIEEYGYGKGYVAAFHEWRAFYAELETLQAKTGMTVVLLAHAIVKPFSNPEGENFDRYQLKMHEKASGQAKEWADAVLFAQYEQFSKKEKGALKGKGIATGARKIFTIRAAAYDAKNRFNLPEQMPLNWLDFEEGVEAFYAEKKPESVKADRSDRLTIDTATSEIRELALRMSNQNMKECNAALERAGQDQAKLLKLHKWATELVAERQSA